MSRQVISVFIASVYLVCALGCNDSKSAAEKAIAGLEKQVDMEKLQEWAQSLIAAQNPAERFTQEGKAIPKRILKTTAMEAPTVALSQFENGEWFVIINGQMGLETYGIAFGRDNARFPDGYKVYRLRPGVYYFFSHL